MLCSAAADPAPLPPQEARKREAEEVAQHMSAHREQVRAARARVSKEQLNALGAQFAARLASSAGDDPGKVRGGGRGGVVWGNTVPEDTCASVCR